MEPSKLRRLVNRTLFCLLAGPCLLPLSVYGQEEEEGDVVLEEITVTARKREVALQKAPIAISAVDGQDLSQAAVAKLDDFNGYVPGLVIAKNDGAGRVVSIRGIGWETAQTLATQPSVLVYIDGVYLANPLSLGLDLGEIERVEVLRGPQGTEYGQGTTGGAINIITRKAKPGETGGSLDVRAGDYGLLDARGTLRVGGERTALIASVQQRQHDGFAEIRGGALDGYELDDADVTTAHLSFVWNPNDAFAVRLSGFLNDRDNSGAAQKHIADPNPNPRELTQDYPSTFSLENSSFSAVIDWTLSSGIKLSSLTGLQTLAKNQTMDGDRLTTELTSVNLTGFYESNFDILPRWINDSDAFSQELNLTGSTESMDWVVGAYYLDHENFNDFLEAVAPGSPSDYQEQLDNPGPDTLPPFQPPLEFVETRTVTREDRALYGQITYRLNDITGLTFGGRYQRDKSTDEATQYWFINSVQVLEDEAFTWKVGVDVNIDDDHLFYGLISTGWKNGGNNPGALNGALDVPLQFEPEEVTAFEIGTKNTLADNHVRLNATAFYYDYKNFQFMQEDPVPFAGGAGNVPALTIYGLESEFNWLLDEHWRLDGHVSLADGEIDSDLMTLDTIDFLHSGFGRFLPNSIDNRASIRVNLRGNTPAKLVKQSARLVLSYNRALDSGSIFSSRIDYIYRGEFQYRVFNNPLVDTVPSYNTVSLNMGYDFAGLPLEASLSLNNAFDEAGVNARFSNPFGLHTTSEEYIPPRQVILRLRYTF